MYTRKDIILAADYHEKNVMVRWFNCHTGQERLVKCRTTAEAIGELVRRAAGKAAEVGGRVIWIMESTTGWARVKRVVGPMGSFIVANVLQMPLAPKAHRRKTDKADTKRMLREFLNGTLPMAYQPNAGLRRLRRLVSNRETLVSRRTAARNWMNRYLAHESWACRSGLWTAAGMRRLEGFVACVRGSDRVALETRLRELRQWDELLAPIRGRLLRVYGHWRQAQWLDEVYGIGPISAVSILARIWPIHRFAGADALIAYAGLAPGVRQSEDTRRMGRIGGGGTDKHLRTYLIEASVWARHIPRYRAAYLRTLRRRGKKIARVVVARMLLRSIYRMLRRGERFDRLPAA